MSVFEAVMLLCFGLSWPISIAKTLRTKEVRGKSPLFMGLLCFGYLNGIAHKLIYCYDWIIFLYVLNLVLISCDLALYFIYSSRYGTQKTPGAPAAELAHAHRRL